MNNYLSTFWKFFDFDGRASRKEFWSFVLINFFIRAGLLIFAITKVNDDYFMDVMILFIIFNVVVLLPSLTVSIRRLHDIGKSGWYFLIAFIPFIGAIWVFFYYITDSEVGENTYGDNPKGITKEKYKQMLEEEAEERKIRKQVLENEELLK